PEAKQRCLDVKPQTIERHSLTSEEVAREMALGALHNSRANLATANTGVADDTDKDTPAGTQCYAWAFPLANTTAARIFSETCHFEGGRNQIREASARYALQRIPHYTAQARKFIPTICA